MSTQEKNNNRSLWAWILAFLGGAAVAVFYSPWTGRKTRNWVSQKATHYSAQSQKMADRASAKLRWNFGKAEGLMYKARSFLNPTERADLDDDLITARVTTKLGENPLTWDLPRINVNTVDGLTTIRGPVNSVQQLSDVENVVLSIKGVKGVVNDLRIVA